MGSTAGNRFDPYLCILLGLFLSTMASVQATALLIAATRADAISLPIALHNEHTTEDLV